MFLVAWCPLLSRKRFTSCRTGLATRKVQPTKPRVELSSNFRQKLRNFSWKFIKKIAKLFFLPLSFFLPSPTSKEDKIFQNENSVTQIQTKKMKKKWNEMKWKQVIFKTTSALKRINVLQPVWYLANWYLQAKLCALDLTLC